MMTASTCYLEHRASVSFNYTLFDYTMNTRIFLLKPKAYERDRAVDCSSRVTLHRDEIVKNHVPQKSPVAAEFPF